MAKSPCGKDLVPYDQGGAPIVGRWDKERAELMACPDCGYLVFEPRPTDAMLGAYYGGQYWEQGSTFEEARQSYAGGEYYRLAAEEIAQIWADRGTGAPLRVHEIGCGYGGTVHFLRRNGVEATGSDLSASAVDIARQLGNPHTYCAGLEQFLAERPDDPINVFYMSHSLEHIPDAVATLRTIYERLPEGGLLIVRVPNGMHLTSRMRSFYEYTWLQYPDHIHYFTPRSSICAMDAGGFVTAEVTNKGREEHVELMFSALLGRAWAELPEPSALIIGIAKNWLGMEMQVIARKGGATDPALIERAVRFESGLENMRPADFIAGDNAAGFSLTGDGEWTYESLHEGRAHALTLAGDKKRLESPHTGVWVQRTLQLVPVGQTLRMSRTAPPEPARSAGVLEVAFSLILPHAGADGSAEITLLHKGAEVRRVRVAGDRRVSHRIHIKARPGERLALDVHMRAAKWPSLYLHADVQWLTLG
jgi:SAM-dependent methyltransferase